MESNVHPADKETDDDLDAQIIGLLTGPTQDTGDATETVHLDALSPAEKRAVLTLLHKRLETNLTNLEAEADE